MDLSNLDPILILMYTVIATMETQSNTVPKKDPIKERTDLIKFMIHAVSIGLMLLPLTVMVGYFCPTWIYLCYGSTLLGMLVNYAFAYGDAKSNNVLDVLYILRNGFIVYMIHIFVLIGTFAISNGL